MVTGETRFARPWAIPAFAMFKDLTLDKRAADLLGYTHEEMETYFHEHIQAFAESEGISYEKMFARLLDWYDSYQFSPDRLVKVVNPVSLGKALANKKIANYWEATAGSTLIFDALKAGNKAPVDFNEEVDMITLDAADALTAPASALLYQGGYLTIDEPIDEFSVRLKIPNNEVKTSLYRGYVGSILGYDYEIDGMTINARRTARAISTPSSSKSIRNSVGRGSKSKTA